MTHERTRGAALVFFRGFARRAIGEPLSLSRWASGSRRAIDPMPCVCARGGPQTFSDFWRAVCARARVGCRAVARLWWYPMTCGRAGRASDFFGQSADLERTYPMMRVRTGRVRLRSAPSRRAPVVGLVLAPCRARACAAVRKPSPVGSLSLHPVPPARVPRYSPRRGRRAITPCRARSVQVFARERPPSDRAGASPAPAGGFDVGSHVGSLVLALVSLLRLPAPKRRQRSRGVGRRVTDAACAAIGRASVVGPTRPRFE
jgi:hypothetical protein